VDHVDARALLEELARQVARAADAGGGVVELARLCLASATNSASVFAAMPGWTTITLGKTTPIVIGAMSLRVVTEVLLTMCGATVIVPPT
jgi:hypothetical protein